MKKLKKTVSVLLSVLLILSMAMTALADTDVSPSPKEYGEGKGSVTINDAEIGETYTIYRIFDATLGEADADGNRPVSYTINKNAYPDLYAELEKQTTLFTLRPTGNPNVFQVSKASENNDSSIQSWLKNLKGVKIKKDDKDVELLSTLPSYTLAVDETSDNKAEFKQVPYGYYWVIAEGDDGVTGVTVSSADPDAVMNLKINRIPSNPQKVVDEKSVSVGDVLTYESSFKATNILEQKDSDFNINANKDYSDVITEYTIKDTPDEDATIMSPDPNKTIVVYPASALKEAGNLDDNGNIKVLTEDLKDKNGNVIAKKGMLDLYDNDGNLVDHTVVSAAINENKESVLYGGEGNDNNGFFLRKNADGTFDTNSIVIPWAKNIGTEKEPEWVSLYESPSYVVSTYTQTVGEDIMSQGDENGEYEYYDYTNSATPVKLNFTSKTKLTGDDLKAKVEEAYTPEDIEDMDLENALEKGKIKAVYKVDGQFVNTMQVFYNINGNPSTPKESTPHLNPVSVTSCSTGLSIRKLVAGGTDNDTLEGAKFILSRIEGEGEDEKVYYYAATPENLKAVKDAETAYKAADTTDKIMAAMAALKAAYDTLWSTEAKDAVQITADNDYTTMEFKSLKEGTYLLKEVDAPQGYQVPDKGWEIVITHSEPDAKSAASSHYTMQTREEGSEHDFEDVNLNENGFFTAKIENSKGSALPETGGIGTTMMIVCGAVMFAAAGILLVSKKRMYNEG